MERQSKGIWFPIEIWEAKDLSWNEKILLLEIDSFTSSDKDCFISNEYIADLLKVTETSANKILSSLIRKGYVIKTAFDGRRRFVKSALTLTTKQGCSKEQGCLVEKNNILNTNTCIDILKEKEDKSSKKKEEEFVERMYAMYPTKCPKRGTSLGKSHKDKERIRKLLKKYSMEQIEIVFNHEIEEKYDKQYMSNFSTFLNNFPDPNAITTQKSDIDLGDSKECTSEYITINGQIYR